MTNQKIHFAEAGAGFLLCGVDSAQQAFELRETQNRAEVTCRRCLAILAKRATDAPRADDFFARAIAAERARRAEATR